MKYILLLSALFVSGCYKNKTPYEYELAGMLDEAEKAYQKQILETNANEIKIRRDKQKELLQFYIKTDQIEKADKFASLLLIKKDTGELDHLRMAEMYLEVAERLYNAKLYRRAYFQFKNSADFYLADLQNLGGCKPKAIKSYYLAYDAAKKEKLVSEYYFMKQVALNLINESECSQDAEAQKYRSYFDLGVASEN